jgi:hypothetical protein
MWRNQHSDMSCTLRKATDKIRSYAGRCAQTPPLKPPTRGAQAAALDYVDRRVEAVCCGYSGLRSKPAMSLACCSFKLPDISRPAELMTWVILGANTTMPSQTNATCSLT